MIFKVFAVPTCGTCACLLMLSLLPPSFSHKLPPYFSFCFSLSQSQSLIIWLSRLLSLSLSLHCSFYPSLFLPLPLSSSPSQPTSLSVSTSLSFSLSWSLIGNDQGTPFQRVSGLFQDFDGQVTQVKSGDVAFPRNIIICLWFSSSWYFISSFLESSTR